MSHANPTAKTWVPTHEVAPVGRAPVQVMLLPPEAPGGVQAAYTHTEWICYDPCDYTVNTVGEWLFQGHPFAGAVHRLEGA